MCQLRTVSRGACLTSLISSNSVNPLINARGVYFILHIWGRCLLNNFSVIHYNIKYVLQSPTYMDFSSFWTQYFPTLTWGYAHFWGNLSLNMLVSVMLIKIIDFLFFILFFTTFKKNILYDEGIVILLANICCPKCWLDLR